MEQGEVSAEEIPDEEDEDLANVDDAVDDVDDEDGEADIPADACGSSIKEEARSDLTGKMEKKNRR